MYYPEARSAKQTNPASHRANQRAEHRRGIARTVRAYAGCRGPLGHQVETARRFARQQRSSVVEEASEFCAVYMAHVSSRGVIPRYPGWGWEGWGMGGGVLLSPFDARDEVLRKPAHLFCLPSIYSRALPARTNCTPYWRVCKRMSLAGFKKKFLRQLVLSGSLAKSQKRIPLIVR